MMDFERETQAYNPGHKIEGLDRCNTLMIMLDQLLSGHPAVVRVDGEPLVKQAFDALWSLYHKIGTIDDEDDEK